MITYFGIYLVYNLEHFGIFYSAKPGNPVCCTLQMEKLNISNCEIGDDGCISISSCIHNIQKLEIGSIFDLYVYDNPIDNQVTIRGITALSEAIRELTKPVST